MNCYEHKDQIVELYDFDNLAMEYTGTFWCEKCDDEIGLADTWTPQEFNEWMKSMGLLEFKPEQLSLLI